MTLDEYANAAKTISDAIEKAYETANTSAGPNDDRAIVLAIGALTSAVLLAGRPTESNN